MEVIIHTVDGKSSQFEVENGPEEERVLSALHPDKAFGHHHLAIHGVHGVTMIVSSKVTYVELLDVGRTKWPFYDVFFETYELTDSELAKAEPERALTFGELFLADGKKLNVRVESLDYDGMVPCPSFVVERLLAQPSLHIHGRQEKILLVNCAQIVRCNFKHCLEQQAEGWEGNSLGERFAAAAVAPKDD